MPWIAASAGRNGSGDQPTTKGRNIREALGFGCHDDEFNEECAKLNRRGEIHGGFFLCAGAEPKAFAGTPE